MSRTKQVAGGATNPIKATVTYKPNSGEFEIFVKETKKKIDELKEIKLIILDADRFSLTGYSKAYESMFTSNLVHNTKKEPLSVGTFVGGKHKIVAEGLYQDIKEKLTGAKYTKNVLCLLEIEDKFVLADLQLVGTAKNIFMEWYQAHQPEGLVTITPSDELFDYDQKNNAMNVVPKDKQKKWRTTWFYKLEFDVEDIDEDLSKQADQADENLQKYFDGAKSSTPAASDEGKPADDSPAADDDDDDLPF
jgi:hypothetical protein